MSRSTACVPGTLGKIAGLRCCSPALTYRRFAVEEKFDQWALVELYGHQRIVGRVREATIGGCSFVRIDVPAVGDAKEFTRYFGNNAIYSLNPISEDIAMQLAERCRNVPVSAYDLPAPRPSALQEIVDEAPEVEEAF